MNRLLVLLSLGGCSCFDALLREPRQIDAAPVPGRSAIEAPAGVAYASLGMNTGGDQGSPKEVGAEFTVIIGTTAFSQTVASCKGAGRFGDQQDSLGFATPVYVDWLECDEMRLGVRATPTAVEVVDVTTGKVFGSVPIPPGTTVQKR